jgi:hypothetical protein
MRERLQQMQDEDRMAETIWYGHLRELNPNYSDERVRREWVQMAWEFAAVLALVLLAAWLGWLRG